MNTKLCNVLSSMKRRCVNKNDKDFKYYGAMGIYVCDEWANNTKSFVDWAMLNGYKEGLQIDRINNDDGYYPGNCHFVTKRQNSQNTRLLMATNKSGYRGVCKPYKDQDTWCYQAVNLDGSKKE